MGLEDTIEAPSNHHSGPVTFQSALSSSAALFYRWWLRYIEIEGISDSPADISPPATDWLTDLIHRNNTGTENAGFAIISIICGENSYQ